jgi:serine/threonine protein kinase
MAIATSRPWERNWTLVPGLQPKVGNQYSVFQVQSAAGEVLGALKLLQENQTERRARLVREVSDLEKLVGIPGIPRVLEHNASSFERTGDPPYIVLELISGETLNERFQRELDIETSVRLIINLCEIVGSCHARGVCHRDIKPNNIMIGPDISRVWLIDFGMSWSEEAAEHFETEANQEIGNRCLRLPEFSGVHPDEKRDSRSDLAQICGVLFWLLFHRRPGAIFDGQNRPPHRSQAQFLTRAVVNDERWDLLASVFDMGFAPGLDQRFQTAEKLIERLREIVDPMIVEESSMSIEAEYRRLVEFQQMAEVQVWQQTHQAMVTASNSLMRKLVGLANEKKFQPTSTSPDQVLGKDTAYFRFLFWLRPGDPQWVDVSHWIRRTGSKQSDVEALYDFTSNPSPSDSLTPYYIGPAADTRRLIKEVEHQAEPIFAKMLSNLLKAKKEQFPSGANLNAESRS